VLRDGAPPISEGLDPRVRIGIAIGVAVLLLSLLLFAVFSSGQDPLLRLKLTSVPSGADVLVNGRHVGRTPIDKNVERDDETVELRFELAGHEPHQVRIATGEAELRYEAPLRKLETEN